MLTVTELLDALTLYGKVEVSRYSDEWTVRLIYGINPSPYYHHISLEEALEGLLTYCKIIYAP